MEQTFETALASRVDDMLDACTKCGKCFEACPITGAAGIADADPRDTIAGVLDIVRMGEGTAASRKWASSCVLSGECIRACAIPSRCSMPLEYFPMRTEVHFSSRPTISSNSGMRVRSVELSKIGRAHV